jgi:hypothetical protein
MSVRTKTLRTNALQGQCTLAFRGPKVHAQIVREAVHALGFEEVGNHETTDTVPWREAFPQWTDTALPGVTLAGARHKEGLTQAALAQASGIPQRHLSEMERGKRPIGKDRAKALAQILDVDYRIFL